MKKLLACLLALVMVLSLAACGGTEDIRGTQIDVPQDTTPVDTVPVDTVPVDTVPEETTPAEEELSLGVNDGIKYESTFIGLGCTLPEGWTFYTEEQLRELNNITEELVDEAYTEALKDATTIQDMFASSGDGLSNCNVTLEKVNALSLAVTDVKDIYEAQKETLVSGYESMGGANVKIESVTVTIEGKDFEALTLSVDIYGTTLMQTLFCVKCPGYLATLVVTADSAEAMQAVLDCFYLV